MMRMLRHSALLVLAGAGAASAQLPNASAAATGLGGAYTARARGYDAVAWNPANLGLSNNPAFSIGFLSLHGSSGLDPISLNDFAPYSGKVLPASQREAWLQQVIANGGQSGRVDGGLTIAALSAGPFALQISSALAGSTKLNADAFEAIMFGNAGRTGTARDMSLLGSTLRVGAFTTAGASYGVAIGDERGAGRLALGVTGKYVVGNALGMAQDDGSTMTVNGVTVSFPMVFSRPESDVIVGAGAGADVGLAYAMKRFSFGASVQNVFNSFAWDETKLYAKAGTAIFNGETNNTNFEDAPYASAPASLRAKVADDKFEPIVSGGIALDVASWLSLSADARQQLGDALLLGPKTQAGVGVEFRGIPGLALRGGASYVTDGWGVSGGFGIRAGRADIGLAAGLRTVNGGKEPVVTLSLLSFR
jgi:hypothetical protein